MNIGMELPTMEPPPHAIAPGYSYCRIPREIKNPQIPRLDIYLALDTNGY
jgi:hypothetical protein